MCVDKLFFKKKLPSVSSFSPQPTTDPKTEDANKRRQNKVSERSTNSTQTLLNSWKYLSVSHSIDLVAGFFQHRLQSSRYQQHPWHFLSFPSFFKFNSSKNVLHPFAPSHVFPLSPVLFHFCLWQYYLIIFATFIHSLALDEITFFLHFVNWNNKTFHSRSPLFFSYVVVAPFQTLSRCDTVVTFPTSFRLLLSKMCYCR